MNQIDAKTVVCYATNVFVSYCVANLTMALCALALWYWLAFIIAVLAGMVAGVAAHLYMETTGYDAAVSVAGRALSFVRGLRTAKVAA
jgi:hypothetical protein